MVYGCIENGADGLKTRNVYNKFKTKRNGQLVRELRRRVICGHLPASACLANCLGTRQDSVADSPEACAAAAASAWQAFAAGNAAEVPNVTG